MKISDILKIVLGGGGSVAVVAGLLMYLAQHFGFTMDAQTGQNIIEGILALAALIGGVVKSHQHAATTKLAMDHLAASVPQTAADQLARSFPAPVIMSAPKGIDEPIAQPANPNTGG